MSQGKLLSRGGKAGSRGNLLGVHKDIAATDWPFLPLEAPAAAAGTSQGYPAQRASQAIRRRNDTNRHALSVPFPHTRQAAAASSDSQLATHFETRSQRSRRVQAQDWTAALTAQQQTPAFPIAAIFCQQVRRRRATEREIQAVEPLQWQYIAPTVAAILPRPTAKVIWFERRIQLTQPLDVYPPPTGPPADRYPSWVAKAAYRVSHDRRLQAQAPQASYPATPVPPAVDVASLFATKAIRRKPRNAGFVAVMVAVEVPSAQTVPAEYPAHVPGGYLFRRDTRRVHRIAMEAPVYPVSEVTVSPDRAVEDPFVTRYSRSRRLQVGLVPPVYPATEPQVTTFIAAPVAIKRRDIDRRLLEALEAPVYPQPAPTAQGYPSFSGRVLPARRAARYRSQWTQVPPDTPLAPPVAEQPPDAFKLPRTFRWSMARVHLAPMLVPEWPETPYVPPVVPDGGIGGPERWEMEYWRLKDWRAKARKKRREREEETARIEALLDRAIAVEERKAEAVEERKQEIAQARKVAELVASSSLVSERLRVYAQKAAEANTRAALERFEQELRAMQTARQAAVLLLLLNQ